jgi:hypothetical protein
VLDASLYAGGRSCWDTPRPPSPLTAMS